jgi:hypothetical protein
MRQLPVAHSGLRRRHATALEARQRHLRAGAPSRCFSTTSISTKSESGHVFVYRAGGAMADGTVGLDRLGDEIAVVAAQIQAATCRSLGLVARFDACEGCH